MIGIPAWVTFRRYHRRIIYRTHSVHVNMGKMLGIAKKHAILKMSCLDGLGPATRVIKQQPLLKQCETGMENGTVRTTEHGNVVITHVTDDTLVTVYAADIESMDVVGMQDGTDELVLHIQEQETIHIPHLACSDVTSMIPEIYRLRALWREQRRSDQKRVTGRQKLEHAVKKKEVQGGYAILKVRS